MTEGTAPPSKTRSLSRRIRDNLALYPAAVAVGVYAIVAIAAVLVAYVSIFTIFQRYDDEGTLLVTLDAFVHGDALYRDIYSAYGPFYYELFGGLFALTGQAITTDASRSIVIVIWVGTSLLFGLAAHRLTGRLALGVTAMISAFAALNVLVNEPMHPQVLCVLLLGTFVLLAVGEPSRRIGWVGGACGALLAGLLLTKVNLGVFAVAAIVLAATLTVGPLYRRGWLRLLVIAAFLAMPVFITARDLNLVWVRELLILELLSMSAVLVAALSLRPERGDREGTLIRWLLAALVGFVVAFVVILAIIVITGPSPSDVYDGVVGQAFRIRDLLVLPFPFPTAGLSWGIVAVALAALATRLRGRETAPALWLGLLRAAAGLMILFTVATVAPLGVNISAANPDTWAMVLAWVAAIPLLPRESSHKRFLRVLLPALAVAEALQVYPVAGSQTGIAAVAFVPVGALCLADAVSELRAWSVARGAAMQERLSAVVAVAAVAVASVFALNSMVLPGISTALVYHDQEKLPFAGADLMRLPADEVETYAGLVSLLKQYRCTTFVGYPSVNSLYLWSGLKAPPPQIPNAWMLAFDRDRQQRVVDELRASPRPCAIRSDAQAAPYLHSEAPPDLPLIHYVLNDFTPVAEIGEFQFMLPTERAAD